MPPLRRLDVDRKGAPQLGLEYVDHRRERIILHTDLESVGVEDAEAEILERRDDIAEDELPLFGENPELVEIVHPRRRGPQPGLALPSLRQPFELSDVVNRVLDIDRRLVSR